MKKEKFKIILIVLILLILCINVGVYAATVLSATDVNYTKTSGSTVSVKSALDELYTKVPTKEIGDEVTVGGEQFYVLEWDNNSDVALLMAKGLINVDGTEQYNVKNALTVSAFSSVNYWSGNVTSSPFNLNDFIGFESTDALGKAKSYGISKGAVSSRLLSYEEAYALKTKASSDEKISTMLWGLDSLLGDLSYWLGSATKDSNQKGVYWVSGQSKCFYWAEYDMDTIRDTPGYNYIKI